MATFLYDFVHKLEENWCEVDILLVEAKKYENSNLELYNALCRSISVLIVAHLEGFVKELAKALIHDFNNNCSFKELPPPIQRTYCRKYLGNINDSNKKNHENKVKILMEKFSEVECKISYEPFFSKSNKNPKPDVIQTIFQNFGVKSVFSHLHESKIDSVFSDTPTVIKSDIEEQKKYILNIVETFPYSGTLTRMQLEKVEEGMPKRTLWEEFLDQINMKRHGVAHGSNFDNVESAFALESIKDKVIYLQLVLIELLAYKTTATLNN